MADNDVEIRVRVRDFASQGMRNLDRQARAMAGTLNGAANGLLKLGGGAQVIPVLLGVAAAAQASAGALLLLPGAAAAAGAIAGTLGLALGGVSEALTATSTSSATTGAVVSNAARQIRNAQRAVADATRGVEDALRGVEDAERGVITAERALQASHRGVADAARRVEDAERGVTDAQRGLADAHRGVEQAQRRVEDTLRAVERAEDSYIRALADERAAQDDIAQARRDAVRDLADLDEAQSDAARSVEGASIALRRAVEAEKDVLNDGKATYLDREEAAHRVRDAQDRLSDAERDAADASAELDEARRKGVDGSDRVVAAEDKLRAAQERTQAASEGVLQAQESVQEAHEGVADARRQVEAAERGVAAAVRGVEDAERGVADARNEVADAELGVADAHRQVEAAQQGVVDAQQAVIDAQENLRDAYADAATSAGGAAGGADAYREALGKLSPEAQAMVETLRALTPEWEALQRSVQDRFFAGLSEDVQDLADTYLPVLDGGLGGIADRLNGIAGYALAELLAPDAVADVNSILASTAGFLENSRTALGDFVLGLINLAEVGATYLPGFGTWLADIAGWFRRWTEEGDGTNGAISRLIDRGLQGFADLWTMLTDLWGIISAIQQGLSGGGDAGFLGGMIAGFRRAVEDPTTQMVLGILGELFRIIVKLVPYWLPLAVGIKAAALAMGLFNLIMGLNPIAAVLLAIGALVLGFKWAWDNISGFREFWIGFGRILIDSWNNAVGGVRDGIEWLGGKIQAFLGWMGRLDPWGWLKAGLKGAVNFVISQLNGLITGTNMLIYGFNVVSPWDIPYIPYIRYLAKGGIGGGMAVVGEQGPELVRLPQGSTVYPTGQSREMLAGSGSAGSAPGELRLVVARGADSAVADLIMHLIRIGKIRLERAA